MSNETFTGNISDIVKLQKNFFYSGKTLDVDFRIENLKKLKNLIIEHEDILIDALKKDLNKSPFESYETEIGMVLDEISFTLKNIKKWCKVKKVKTPLSNFLSRSYVHRDPFGVSLIIAPWNYPFQLSIAPLIGAISGGNCAIIKSSEYSKYTSKALAKIINENFNKEYLYVVLGGVKETTELLKEHFDYIFFTGSTNVGKIVMEAASKNLTPITLELGGKSPCIIDSSANIDLAAKRLVWGKLLNAGQTCVAPDYFLVHESIKDELITKMKEYIIKFYGENPLDSNDYVRIINEKHFNRLLGLIEEGDIVFGGNSRKEELKISPTIIDNVSLDFKIMKEEIFGPLFPIITFKNINEVISLINSNSKPLALYLFTENKDIEHLILKNTFFGGGCVNDTIVHLATPYMGFGGVGGSGMGSYHGIGSFNTFTHKKSILKKSNLIDVNIRYAPYKESNLKIVKKLMK